jgi:hypothetical protein
MKSAGVKFDIIFTGWMGTPVHELGHAIFCILFRHRIVDIKLYKPDLSSNSLGYVNHTYNQKSRYQKIGNFFIGIGPILFGALVIYALLFFLMPEFFIIDTQLSHQNEQLNLNSSWIELWKTFTISAITIFSGIFNLDNLSNFRFWIFIYFSFCISSHMELSPPDINGAKSGLITIVLTVLFLNFLIISLEYFGINYYFGEYWQYLKIETYSIHINNFLGIIGALLSFTLIISVFNFVLSYIGLSIYNLIKGYGFINPFWK